MEHLHLEEVFPSYVLTFSVFRELLACQVDDLHVVILTLNENRRLYKQSFPRLKKLQLSLHYLATLGPTLSLVRLDSSFQKADLPIDSVVDFELSDCQISVLTSQEFFVIDLATLTETKRIKLGSEFLGVVSSVRRTLLYSRKSVVEVGSTSIETVYSAAPIRTFLRCFVLEEPSLQVQHIPGLELLLVTTQNSSVFLQKSGALCTRYPTFEHNKSPLCALFVSPCFLVVVHSNNSCVYHAFSGKLLVSSKHPTLLPPAALQDNRIFLRGNEALLALCLPTEDQVFGDLLKRGKFELALELCGSAASKMQSRVYFECGVHKFLFEHNFQEAAHFMRKCDLPWAVAAIFRKIVSLPSYVQHATAPLISAAVDSLEGFSLRPSYFSVFKDNTSPLGDSALQSRALVQFIPYYQYLAKFSSDFVQMHAQAWLFDVLLSLPPRGVELLPILSDPQNKLPLSYCEKALLKHEMYDLLLELFLARQVIHPALKLLQSQYQKTRDPDWLIRMQHFLSQINKGAKDFFSFSAYLFGEDSKLAIQLMLDMNPPILSKADVEKEVIPHLLRYGGPSLAILYLERCAHNHGDLLARLYLAETVAGRFNPSHFAKFLRDHWKSYDAEALLEQLPKHRLQKERLILLDVLNRTEDIIHMYVRNKEVATAILYVKYKRCPEATNHLVRRLSQPPLSQSYKTLLLDLLNNSDPELFDSHYVLSTLPKTLNVQEISPFLTKTFAYLTASTHKAQLRRRLSDNIRLETFTINSLLQAASIEVTDDTTCEKCRSRLGVSKFSYFKGKFWHLGCSTREICT